MTIISGRQTMYDLGKVPEVVLVKQELASIYVHKYNKFMDVLIPALKQKYVLHDTWSSPMSQNIIITVEQTMYYLEQNNMIKSDIKIPENFELWNDTINLGPKYEGIVNGLNTALYERLYPRMFVEMQKGHAMDHWGLTTIRNCVEYVLEFMMKEGYLIEDKVEAK